jgi:pyruvate formate lyase activating enzyme
LDHAGGRVDLLPYHVLGQGKYQALGRDYPWGGYARLRDEEIDALIAIYRKQGLSVRVGG